MLLRRADERAAMADELQLERDWLAGIALLGGHAAATAPADLPLPSQALAPLASNEDLLADCERADGCAVEAWRDALEQSLPERLKLLLQEQHRMLLRSHRRTQVLLHLARHGNVLLPLQRPAAATTSLWSPALTAAPQGRAAESLQQG